MDLLAHLFRRDRAGKSVEPPVELSPLEAGQLSSVFTPPRWLRDLGRTSWLLVGLFLLVVGIIWLLGTTQTIVGPVVAATIVATVMAPLVRLLTAHRLPRAAAAAIVLLGVATLAFLVVLVVIGGITSQGTVIGRHATDAANKAEGWLKDLDLNESGASTAKSGVEKDVPKIISALTTGVIHGIQGVTSIVFGLSLAALSLFFLLKDGPSMRAWIDRHLGVPQPVAQTITGGMIRSLQGYFRGVTLVAAFNGIVVGLAALILGVPLAGTIAVVTFVTAYVPFIGAFFAGAFAVVIALGAEGTTTALVMLLVVILANGLLQNLVQPFAMGSALDLHPLAVLVLTIGAGCVFGMLGLVLAAPIASAAVHITTDLARVRASASVDAVDDRAPAEVPPEAPTAGA
ncbi:MAG: AI-2E family transporter [Actinobacteria bacterium]|nr:MAG: AI-2E family transporter [Actinomycetota bacterium]